MVHLAGPLTTMPAQVVACKPNETRVEGQRHRTRPWPGLPHGLRRFGHPVCVVSDTMPSQAAAPVRVGGWFTEKHALRWAFGLRCFASSPTLWLSRLPPTIAGGRLRIQTDLDSIPRGTRVPGGESRMDPSRRNALLRTAGCALAAICAGGPGPALAEERGPAEAGGYQR